MFVSPARRAAALVAGLALTLAPISPARSATAPDAPAADARATTSSVLVTWKAPAANGSQILGYVVRRQARPGGSWKVIARPAASARSYQDVDDTLSPVVAGRLYSYRVYARNRFGTGTGSTAVRATPYLPSAPRDPAATSHLFGVKLTWSAPTSTGGSGITSYVIERSADAGATWQRIGSRSGTAYDDVDDPGSPFVEGHAYRYRVRARNAGGTSRASTTVTATPEACPAGSTTTLHVNALATPSPSFAPTGVSTPIQCAFPTITSATTAASAAGMGPGDEIVLDGADDAGTVYDHESFPLVLPDGVALTGATGSPLDNVVHITGSATTALRVHGSQVSGVGFVMARTTPATTIVDCTGGTTTLSKVLLHGANLDIARGVWVEPGCTVHLEDSMVTYMNGPGVRVDQGASLTTDNTDISMNAGAGIDLHGDLTSVDSTQMTWIHENAGAGVLASAGSSARLHLMRIAYNGESGVVAHGAAVQIDTSDILFNSTQSDPSTTGPQLLFTGAASSGPSLFDPTTGETHPAYVVGRETRIYGYASNSDVWPALRAESGAWVDATVDASSDPARCVYWATVSASVSVTPDAYVAAGACSSIPDGEYSPGQALIPW